MPKSKPPATQPPLPRSPRWPYWVFVPLSALGYTVFCFAVNVFAWGLRGSPKPWWYLVARGLALPGMWLPHYLPLSIGYLGVPLWGGIMGFGLIWLIRRIRSRRPPSIPPRS
ncbi:MAG: hypothetical protein MUF49_24785 [Oculatellaceae cyanobacterium Prado106]|nr:hypothetical protein [Oculatellaceae cyanobacterium Prado106]